MGKLDKKSLVYWGIIIIASLSLLLLIWYLSRLPAIKKEIPLLEEERQQQIIRQQLKELEKLKTEKASLTEKETQAQLKELQELRSKTPSLSDEDIQKQLEELNKLRSQ
jgi:biopolymer transport protein ExbB/TolQ